MITLGDKQLDIADFEQIVLQNQHIEISATAMDNVAESYKFLEAFSTDKLIYGINTGFGPMAQYRIDDTDRMALQYNLIRSHSSGMGQLLTPLQSRAALLARLNTMLLGYSGVHTELVELMTALINADAYPCIYHHGGVGASGDLVQLAHLALGLIGEGNFWFKNELVKASTVYNTLKIQPLKMHIREGLGLLNGTSSMTGIGAINVIHARKLMTGQILFSLMVNEIMEAYDDHFSEELNAVKLHQGQQTVAAAMRAISRKSGLLRKRHEHLYDKKVTEEVIEDKVQEYYSLRCVPQILGPVYDTIEFTARIITEELNSVNDNPVIDRKNQNIFHGGNFHGDYVSLEMDKLKIAVTKLSMLAERQLNFLLNPALNKKLPAFINMGRLGLNFGIQGMQYPAVSNVAENQAMSTPLYIHSIPNNNDNQDIVSMGTNAAAMCARVIENTFEVLSVHAVAIVQAISYKDFAERLSPATRWMYDELSALAPAFTEDEPSSERLMRIKAWLMQTEVGEKMKKLLAGKSTTTTKQDTMKQKYALVTGGSRGIGRAVCVKLAELGYNVLVNYRDNEAAANETAQLVREKSVQAETMMFDIANREEVRSVLGAWMDAHNDDAIVEVLVNNAGIRQDTLLMSMTDEQWDSVIDTSLQGMYHVTKQVLNPMLMNRYGRIINMVSLSGLKGTPGQVNYSAAKSGMIGATKALAQEIAKRNVTVNAVAPGFIKTDMTEELNEKDLSKMIPMQRFGTAEEVAELVGFLASPKSAYVTGQVISINGGLYS